MSDKVCRKCGGKVEKKSVVTPDKKQLATTVLCPNCLDRFTVLSDNPRFAAISTEEARKWKKLE